MKLTTPSAFMRQNTRGILTNPPLSTYGKKSRFSRVRKAAKMKPRRASARLDVVKLGQPLSIEYKHEDGGTYRHRFDENTILTYTTDGMYLIITGANVKAFIEG